ncbi:MAG: family 16 glycoside hydrolase [Alphaproteobacteria bacterium]
MTAGQPPLGFTTGLGGSGASAVWRVEADPRAPRGKVLIQQSTDSSSARYPICLYDGIRTLNADVTVSFATVSGKIDQVAGIVLRATDQGNYYLARASAKDNAVTLSRFVGGSGSDLTSTAVKIPSGTWQTLRFKIDRDRLTVYLNGQQVIDWSDTRHTREGRVGLWTRADAVTMFDDLSIIVMRN